VENDKIIESDCVSVAMTEGIGRLTFLLFRHSLVRLYVCIFVSFPVSNPHLRLLLRED